MFIVYGTKTTRKDTPLSLYSSCDACGAENTAMLVKSTRWFSLFWIPLIPYKAKYFKICSICERGQEIDKETYQTLLNVENNQGN